MTKTGNLTTFESPCGCPVMAEAVEELGDEAVFRCPLLLGVDSPFPLPADAGAGFVCWVYGLAVLVHGSGDHRSWWRDGGELGEAPEVLGSRRQQELVSCAGQAA